MTFKNGQLDSHADLMIGLFEDDDTDNGTDKVATNPHGNPDEGILNYPRLDALWIDWYFVFRSGARSRTPWVR